MNKVVKDDFEEIIKRFKHTNKDSLKRLYAGDFANLLCIMADYFPNEVQPSFPDYMYKYLLEASLLKKEEMNNLREQIIDNIPLLEELYENIINCFNKYDIMWDYYDDTNKELDLNVYKDFYKDYPIFKELYKKINDDEHIFAVSWTTSSHTVILKSIDKNYLFISDCDPTETLMHIPHELGHVYQGTLKCNDNVSGYDFLAEFISILMEHLFIDYYQAIDYKTSEKMAINKLYLWREIFKECLAQIKLLKKYPESFVGLSLNEEYKSELESLCDTNYRYLIDNLYLHFYTIGFLVAINYFYQIKYGLDFEEISKAYIKNNSDNNLNNILNNNIDIESIKQYLRDYVPKNKQKIKRN